MLEGRNAQGRGPAAGTERKQWAHSGDYARRAVDPAPTASRECVFRKLSRLSKHVALSYPIALFQEYKNRDFELMPHIFNLYYKIL